VLGPNLNECQFSSGDVVRDIMTRKMAMFPYIAYPMVDVRDVAQAHLQAILVPEAQNNRFILSTKTEWLSTIGGYLHEKFGQDYSVTSRTVPYCIFRVVCLFDQ